MKISIAILLSIITIHSCSSQTNFSDSGVFSSKVFEFVQKKDQKKLLSLLASKDDLATLLKNDSSYLRLSKEDQTKWLDQMVSLYIGSNFQSLLKYYCSDEATDREMIDKGILQDKVVVVGQGENGMQMYRIKVVFSTEAPDKHALYFKAINVNNAWKLIGEMSIIRHFMY